MENKRYLTAFTIIIFIFVLCIFASTLINKKDISSIGVVNNYSEQSQLTIIKLSPEELSEGKTINLEKTNIVQLQLKNQNYFFEVISLDSSLKKISILFDTSQNYILNFNEEEKINLDSDRFYDLEILVYSISENHAKVRIATIKEELSIVDLFDLRIRSVISNSNKLTPFQIVSIILLLIILFVLVIYIILSKLLPWLKIKNQTEPESQSNVFGYLFSQFLEAKSQNQKDKCKRIYTKIKNLYDYMSQKEKRHYTTRLKEIESYINQK